MSDPIQVVDPENLPAAVAVILERLGNLQETVSTHQVKTDERLSKIERVITLGQGGWALLLGLAGFMTWALGLWDKVKVFFSAKGS